MTAIRVDEFAVEKDAKLISGMLCDNSILLKYFKHQLSPKLKSIVTVRISKQHAEKMIQNYNGKSNLSSYSLYYAEKKTAPIEEMPQRYGVVGNTVSDLTGPRFEPQTSRSRDERVTARPTGR